MLSPSLPGPQLPDPPSCTEPLSETIAPSVILDTSALALPGALDCLEELGGEVVRKLVTPVGNRERSARVRAAFQKQAIPVGARVDAVLAIVAKRFPVRLSETFAQARHDIAVANRVVSHEGIIDAFGHVSMRHPTRPDRYLISHSRSPEVVEASDIYEYTLDSEPVTPLPPGIRGYGELVIHGEIYKARPDVSSVVHCHARPLIPFGVAKGARLRPMFHMCGFLGCGVPIFEIREAGGNTDMLIRTAPLGKALAASLGDKHVVLMRGHGATMVGASIPEAVFRAVYATENASIQMQAHLLGENGEVEFLNAEEAELSGKGRNVPRAWSLWKHQMSMLVSSGTKLYAL
jgi:HCOMODA/2-hydroxy-3-carboxy-muconic semialdehyde decarboxylase